MGMKWPRNDKVMTMKRQSNDMVRMMTGDLHDGQEEAGHGAELSQPLLLEPPEHRHPAPHRALPLQPATQKLIIVRKWCKC